MSDQAGSSQQHLLSQSFLDNNDQSNSLDLITKEFQNSNIDIYGTYENPLFIANQIGKILGIQNVRQVIKDFPEDYFHVSTIYGNKGPRNATVLNEFGLYELISISRKPFARDFRKWTYSVLKEIRLTGEYKQKQQFEQREILYQQREEQHQQEKQQLIEENEKYKKEREDYAITFEKEQYEKDLYIFRQGNEQQKIYYIGQQQGISARLSGDLSGNGLKEIHKIPCINDNLCQNIIQSILERQGCYHKKDDLSSSSFYRCNLRYILLLSKHVCNTINVLYQCRQAIKEDELVNKLQEEFEQTNIIVQEDYTELLQQFADAQQSQSSQSNNNNQLVVVSNENQNELQSTDSTSNIQQNPIADWGQDHLKYYQGMILKTKIKIRGPPSFSRYLNEFLQSQPQKFPNIVYGKIDKKRNKDDEIIRGRGFSNLDLVSDE